LRFVQTVSIIILLPDIVHYGITGNYFNFLTGFIYYSNFFDPTPLVELMLKYQDNMLELNNLAYKPMFTAGVFGQSSPNRSSFNSPQQREDMYAFCKNDRYGGCSLLTVNSFDNSGQSVNWVVAGNYYQLYTGACTDSITTTPENW
jgi:hypothetical protein